MISKIACDVTCKQLPNQLQLHKISTRYANLWLYKGFDLIIKASAENSTALKLIQPWSCWQFLSFFSLVTL